jgi:predicted HTH transcriptional regulator
MSELFNKWSQNDPKKLARRTDPETSHSAAASIAEGGKLSAQRKMMLKCVIENPDLTAAEMELIEGVQRGVPSRRLIELVRAGLIEVSGKRPSKTNGNVMQTYRVVKGVSI